MGSLVGASEDVKKAGGIDTNLNDYAVRITLCSNCGNSLVLVSSYPISFSLSASSTSSMT